MAKENAVSKMLALQAEAQRLQKAARQAAESLAQVEGEAKKHTKKLDLGVLVFELSWQSKPVLNVTAAAPGTITLSLTETQRLAGWLQTHVGTFAFPNEDKE